jgi:2-dehydro-3-deoxy-D-gluconate 5-dehydrogenase
VLAVNLRAVFQSCRRFGRPTLERGTGSIINIASLLSFQGGGSPSPPTRRAKGAVAQLTKALYNVWASVGINVNAVAPGYIATDMNAGLLADPKRLDQISARISAGRWGEPRPLGNVVAFLASPAAQYIHGHVLAIDGGWLAR